MRGHKSSNLQTQNLRYLDTQECYYNKLNAILRHFESSSKRGNKFRVIYTLKDHVFCTNWLSLMKSEVVIEHFFLGQCVIGQEDKLITVKPLSLNQPFNDFNRITIATTVSNASHQKIVSPAFYRFLESSEGFIYD